MTRDDATRLGHEVLRLRGRLSFGDYLAYIGCLAVVCAVIGFSTGKDLSALYSLAAGLLAGWTVILDWRQQVIIHQEGFVWRRLTRTRVVAHSEIRTVRPIGVSTYLRGEFQVVSVTLASGSTLAIARIEDHAQLSRALWDLMSVPATSTWQPQAPTTGEDQ